VFLATKVSPRHFRRADVIRAAEQSLRRLDTEYIDLYQLHWPNYTVSIEETMAAMEELVETGKVRFIGVSNFSAREIAKAQATLLKNRIVSNKVRYNIVDPALLFPCFGVTWEFLSPEPAAQRHPIKDNSGHRASENWEPIRIEFWRRSSRHGSRGQKVAAVLDNGTCCGEHLRNSPAARSALDVFGREPPRRLSLP
jgi:aryl-alcohol dehydrogenase-like predicted oxidoreductase